MRLSHPICTSLLILTLAGQALAQPAPETGKDPLHPTPVAFERARELHRQGSALFVRGKSEEALAAFTAAWALVHQSEIAGNLAECEIQMGRYRDAAEHVAFILNDNSASARVRQVAEARMRDVSKRIATVQVHVNIATATVTINGRTVDTEALSRPVFLDPGEHRFVAQEAGFLDATVTRAVAAGETVTITLDLEKAAAPPSASAASAAPPPAVPSTPPPEHSATTPLLVVGGAVTLVGVAAGTVLAIMANGSAADANDAVAALGEPGSVDPCQAAPTTCQEIADARVDADKLGNLSVVAFGVAGAAAVGTGILYWLWSTDAEKAPALQVSAGPQAASLLFRGEF